MTEEFLEIQETIFSGSTDSISRILQFWPNILAAAGVFLFGWALSIFARKMIEKIGEKLKIAHLAEKSGFKKILQKAGVKKAPSVVVAQFLQGWIVTIFLLSAAKILNLTAVSNFLEKIIEFLPNIVVALFILLFAVRFGDFIGALISGALSIANSNASKVVAVVIKNIVIAFGIMAALVELHIAENLISTLFIGLVAAIALAGGLAFGLGGKEIVAQMLRDLTKKKN